MGKKKQLSGAVVEIDLPQEQIAEPKKKKELSDKQKENLAKGMAILKAKREAKSKKEDQEQPEVKEAPVAVAPVAVAPVVQEPVVKKERKPRVVKNYLTTEDFNSFKNELLTTLKKPEIEMPPPSAVPNLPVPHAIPVNNTPQVIKEIVKERVISGRELLDKIFFK